MPKPLTEADYEHERQETRRKAKLDYNSMVNGARRKGFAQGRREVREELCREKIAAIRFFERMLNKPETPTEDLVRQSLEELTELFVDVQVKALTELLSDN